MRRRCHLCWLQHQELTHSQYTCIDYNIRNSLTHSPVMTSIHLYWLQHQKHVYMRRVQLSAQVDCFGGRLHVRPGEPATVSNFLRFLNLIYIYSPHLHTQVLYPRHAIAWTVYASVCRTYVRLSVRLSGVKLMYCDQLII